METVPKGPPGMRTHFQNKKFTILITGIFLKKKKEKRDFMKFDIMDVHVVCLMYTCMTNNQCRV